MKSPIRIQAKTSAIQHIHEIRSRKYPIEFRKSGLMSYCCLKNSQSLSNHTCENFHRQILPTGQRRVSLRCPAHPHPALHDAPAESVLHRHHPWPEAGSHSGVKEGHRHCGEENAEPGADHDAAGADADKRVGLPRKRIAVSRAMLSR